jgi:hypothetical protein
VELAADYEKQCAAETTPSEDCEILRSLLVVEVTTELRETEKSRDQRGTQEALAALDLVDEPEIVAAACRVLLQFPGTPGIAEKVLPLMLKSRYAEVQRMSANLLSRIEGSELAQVGNIWFQNHGRLPNDTPYTEYPDFPAHYAKLGFPKYPAPSGFRRPIRIDRSDGLRKTASPTCRAGSAIHCAARPSPERNGPPSVRQRQHQSSINQRWRGCSS